jgi:hypothetical protein
MVEDTASLIRSVHALMDEYRESCLWFLREDYRPETPDEALRVLEAIERHGNREAFRKAAALRQWLSRHSSSTSAG